LKNVDKKQRNVNAAITLSVKANIVFNRDSTVFMFSFLAEVNVSLTEHEWFYVKSSFPRFQLSYQSINQV